jgi:hypothetical protein
MTVDREGAVSAMTAIEDAERRTAQAIFYGIASSFLILWGVLTAVGYASGQVWPADAGVVWLVIMVTGFAATTVMVARARRGLTFAQSGLGWRMLYAQLALVSFGVVVVLTLGPFSGRQLDAFWPLLYMLGYVLAGIWVGRFFILTGVAVAFLTIAGFWWAGPWFPLWMAVANGGALVLGGLWLRRQGASL